MSATSPSPLNAPSPRSKEDRRSTQSDPPSRKVPEARRQLAGPAVSRQQFRSRREDQSQIPAGDQDELRRDLAKSGDFDQSQLFKKVYELEFGQAGGEPYAVLVGDFEFDSSTEDVDTLRMVSTVAAAAFAPFVSAASPALLGLDSFRDLLGPRDLKKVFESSEFSAWRSFRETEDSPFVSLVLPRVLARAPYREVKGSDETFSLNEGPIDEHGRPGPIDADDCCWMNASYVLAAKMTELFVTTGWCASIRGADSGGKVENLPDDVFTNEEGGEDELCPTEINIPDRRENELSSLGFIPLVHYKRKNHAAFMGSQTAQKANNYSTAEAGSNAALSARLS